ncbi:hypothetical protein [Deinococcus yavapaiensis]|nr:hypothetical protein [Deinococcus yavapaiensis]
MEEHVAIPVEESSVQGVIVTLHVNVESVLAAQLLVPEVRVVSPRW